MSDQAKDSSTKYAPKNPELHRAIRAYVVAAVSKAKELANASGLPQVYRLETFPYIEFNKAIQSLAEFEPCLKALKADEVVNTHLGTLIGRATFARRSLEPEVLMTQLPRLGIYRNELCFHEVYFEREYENFETGFYTEGLRYELVAPLLGIQFENPFCIKDVEICIVDAIDLSKPLFKPAKVGITHFECRWALRTVYTLPKRIGKEEFDQLAEQTEEDLIKDAANKKIDRTVAILRLLQGSAVSAIERIHRTRNWFFEDVRAHNARFEPQTQFSLLTGEEFEKSVRMLDGILEDDRVTNTKHLQIALKRFSDAHERNNQEDQIIDLTIAGEAIFLPPGSTAELNYRLRLNAALFIGHDAESRSRIFKDFRLAYELRSSLVHGSDPKEALKRIKKEESGQFGNERRLTEFTTRFREHIRFALVRMIRLTAIGHGLHTAENWDALALGNATKDYDQLLTENDS